VLDEVSISGLDNLLAILIFETDINLMFYFLLRK
jgi:hypothetical protein